MLYARFADRFPISGIARISHATKTMILRQSLIFQSATIVLFGIRRFCATVRTQRKLSS